ncbi:SPTCS protein, partial [Amia calva]|nr:SPTCS protein [Amia calva]
MIKMLNRSDYTEKGALEILLVSDTGICEDVPTIVQTKAAKSPSSWLCYLTSSGSLQFREPSADGGSGRCVTMTDGTYTDFLWEDVSGPCSDRGGLRLLALTAANELRLYQLAEAGEEAAVPCAGVCAQDSLMRLVEDKDLSISHCVSLRLLCFGNTRCIVLLNNCILVQLVWDERGEDPVILSCCSVGIPPQALDNIADCQICRGSLFILANTGHIYIFDMADGKYLASVDLPLYHSATAVDSDTVPSLASFCLFQVSEDLSTVVAITCFNSAICVNLNNYFRRFPDHLLYRVDPSRLPFRAEGATDQDSLSSAACSQAQLGASFHTDRSWEARLSFLYSTVKALPSHCTAGATWYQDLPHIEGWSAPVASPPLLCAASPLGLATVLASKEPCQGAAELQVTEGVLQFQLQGKSLAPATLSVSEFSAVLTFISPGNSEATIVFWDLQTREATYHCSHSVCVPVQPCGQKQLCLVLKDSGLCLLLFGVSQEELLNRLMVYGCAGTVDSLCHLNGWGRCSIPIHALEAGLKNHQLDTVDFFLKSKENLLCPPAGYNLLEQSAVIPTRSQLKSVEDLCPAFDLLCSAIKETHAEAQSKQFSEQLLSITLTFLNKQVREILTGTEELDECLQGCVDILNGYISELRSFMKRFPWSQSAESPAPSTDHTHTADTGQRREWRSLSAQDVIQKAIMNNEIPEAQAFFRAVQNPAEELGDLLNTGLLLAFRCLARREVEQAATLLRNMGFNVKEQLYRICLYTDDRDLRNFVVEELQKNNYLLDKDETMVQFIKQVESLCLRPARRCTRGLSRSSLLQREQNDPKSKAVLEKAVHPVSDPQPPPPGCPGILLDWASHWDPGLQNTILLSRLPEDALHACNSEVLWMYLTSLHDKPRICQWIKNLRFLNGNQSGPSQWPLLTADTVNHHTLCSSYLRNEILDMLARMGVFVQSELADFEQVLWRLSQVGGVIQQSPPVPQYCSLDSLDFHSRFTHYCLENGLRYLLYSYVEHYRLNPQNCPALADRELYESHPWFEMLVKLQEIARNPTDPEIIFQASLTNAQILIPSSQACVSSMLLEGHTLLALSTIMFAPGGVDQVVGQMDKPEDSLCNVDLQLLKMALSPYPKLKSALFPQTNPRGAPPSDISLYHLIQSLTPLDPSSLFGWQSANTLATVDASAELPHFSSPHIVNKHAVIDSLDFLYYLRHSRPSFAFGTFLVQQLSSGRSFKQQIILASDQACSLALMHFYVPSVTAACICFFELLGVSSLKIRVDLKVLNLILKYWKWDNEDSRGASLRDSLAEKGSKLVDSERQTAEELLNYLEEAVNDNIDRRGISRWSYEAGQEWSLAVYFSRLRNLPLSSAYLQACASNGQWLNFLLFSQLHSYPPQQVRALTAQFSPALQAHLCLAFEHLQLASQWENTGQGCTESAIWKSDTETPRELFQVLLQSLDKPSPWRYLLSEAIDQHCPTLAVLAACVQNVNLLQCLCVWILTSVDDVIISEATNHIGESLRQHEWNLHDLSIIWKTLLQKRSIRPLIRGFQLFQQDCPLISMLQMYELCCDYKNYAQAKNKLLKFQKCLVSIKNSSVKPSTVIPVQWTESQASCLLQIMMLQCSTQYELKKLLQLLADMDRLLKSSGPDFKTLSLLSQIVQDTPVSISHSLLEAYSTEALQTECQKIMEQLQQSSQFALARQVAELAGLPVDRLVNCELLQDLQNLKANRQWERKETKIAFWRKCHDRFDRNGMSSAVVSEFFLHQADVPGPQEHSSAEAELLFVQEKSLLLTLAGHWLSMQDPLLIAQLEEMEKKIWMCRIHQQALLTDMERESIFMHPVLLADNSFEDIIREFSFSKLSTLNSPKYLRLDGLPSEESSQCCLESTEREALATLVGQLLDEGCINEASRVCRYFDFYSRDLVLVLHCRSLASGEGDSSELQPKVQALLTTGMSSGPEGSCKRPSLSSTASLGSCSSLVVVSQAEDQLVTTLRLLTDECHHGKNYCKQVLSLYELSKELQCSYNEISAEESEKVLRKVLLSPQPDRYRKARAFISVQSLPPETVAELLCTEVLQGLLAAAQESEMAEIQIYNPSEGKEAFLQLAKLCGDPNLVGTKLLDNLSRLPPGELSCTVELLILAHDCFSLTCHMEGIVRVLQTARHLSHTHLAHRERYSLLVRLLTGIGRYNDMTYIFDLLNQNHRFEMLLRKKVESNSTLKTALLDYIKRCHPGDSEKHNMVALCFSMSREIGENHEGAARTQLKLIESQSWVVTPELKNSLLKVLTLLKDAAESYSKDSCVRQGVRCVKLAKLIALQLHFLDHGQEHRIINLQRQEILNTIVSLPHFYQALLVAEAYDFSPDWAEVLYQKVILNGDFAYLEEFKHKRLLQASFFEEISKKFQYSKPNASASQNLKKLLKYCEDIYIYYKLAYEHKFFDVANMLLQDAKTSCYLNDRLAS